MMSKISVMGDNIHPVYQLFTLKSKNGKMASETGWNFQKCLIDMVKSKVKPTNEKILNWIKN